MNSLNLLRNLIWYAQFNWRGRNNRYANAASTNEGRPRILFQIEQFQNEERIHDAIQNYLDVVLTSEGEIVITGVERYEDLLVFDYNTAKFIASGYWVDGLTGNGPLLVDKKNGNVIETGTADPVEEYINEYINRDGLP